MLPFIWNVPWRCFSKSCLTSSTESLTDDVCSSILRTRPSSTLRSCNCCVSLFDADCVTAPGYGLKRVCKVVRPGCLPGLLEDVRVTDVEVVVTVDIIIMHLSIYCPTTPLPGTIGGTQRHLTCMYSVFVKSHFISPPWKGDRMEIWQTRLAPPYGKLTSSLVKSHLAPMGHYIDRCIIDTKFGPCYYSY